MVVVDEANGAVMLALGVGGNQTFNNAVKIQVSRRNGSYIYQGVEVMVLVFSPPCSHIY